MLIGARAIFWLLALLTLVVLGLQFGLWQKEVRLTGPFDAETIPPTHALILAIPGEQSLVGKAPDRR